MSPALPFGLAALLSGILAVWGKHPSRMQLHWIAKPATVVLIIAATLVMPSRLSAPAYACLLTALGASLIGDICLMFNQRLFVPGLFAFLLAHVAYLVCFGLEAPSLVSQPVFLLALLPVAFWVGRQLWPHLGRLKPAVLLYIVALVAVAWRLLARFALVNEVGWVSCVYSAAGAVLFVLSDSLLSLRRLAHQKVPYTLELGAYFGAQWCIAASTWVFVP